MCEHYISHGLCTDFPDWSIAAAGSEGSVKIGYDYGRMVTGDEQQIEPDLTEEAVQAAGDQEVPDPLDEKAMVVTSVEVIFVLDCYNTIVGFFFVLLFTMFHSVLLQALVELNLDAVDLVDDAPTFFESTPHEHGELTSVTLYCLI